MQLLTKTQTTRVIKGWFEELGTFDSLALYDLNGLSIDTILSEDGVIKVPDQPGMYILKINANNQTYSIKLVVI